MAKRFTLSLHDAETGAPLVATRGVTVNTVLTHKDIFDTFLKELGDHLWQRLQDGRTQHKA